MHKKRIFKFFRSTVSVALAVSLMLGEIGTGVGTVYAGSSQPQMNEVMTESETEVSEAEVNGGSEYGLLDSIQDGAILHCFDWKYNDIKDELPNIAAAGFTSVQTSPAQRAGGEVWYMLYQPQSFSISSNALGSKSDLEALCSEAEKYGIKIIVDVVANHMRGDGTDVDGNMSKNNHPDFWHHDDLDSGRNIDWNNRYQVTHGRIGMYDLNSEHAEVQNIIAGYISELQGAGVDGIRWDAAKHISLPSEQCNFWPAVTSQGLFHYGEILKGPDDRNSGNEAIMKEYTNYMTVTDNEYGAWVRSAFEGGRTPEAIGKWSEKGVPKNRLIYWAESHDTYSNDGEYGEATQYVDQNIIDRAYAIVAAQAKSSVLYFSRPHAKNKGSIMAGAKGSTAFTSKEVAAVNHMRNACVGQKEYYVNGNGVAAVCRESGATIVKGSGSGQVSVQNGGGLVAPGTYIDEVSGSTWTVTSSTISGNIGSSGIAVIYNQGAAGAGVSASVSDGSSFTTETLDVTFTVSNAKSAKYSINGGAATDFSGSVKLTLGADTAFGSSVSVKITATNEEGKTTEKTFTYKKKEAGKVQKNTVYFTKPSGWGNPNIYAYVSGVADSALVGAWPGTGMTDEGNGVYSYTFADSVSTAKVIFNDGANQTPEDEEGKECGYDYISGKAYEYVTDWKEVPVSGNNTPTPTKKPENTPTTKPTNTPTTKPENTPTTKPENTPTTKPTNTPVPDGPDVTASMADGASFDTETTTVKLTLSNADKGTYSVDEGPVKEFTGSADVVIGKGKIADRDVTVKVTATGAGKTTEKTFTYKKNYAADIVAAPEETVDEAEVNAAPDTTYATNPKGQVGSKKTIKSAADFDDSMIIAQGVANDDPAAFKGPHEAPKFDLYAMYGAWDDTNIYIGLQYTNVIDVVAPEQNAPQEDRGKPYSEDADIPQMLLFDTGSDDYTDGSTNDTKQTTAWAIDVKYSGAAKVDKIYCYSPKKNIVNQAFFPVTGGVVDYKNVIKTDYHYVNTQQGDTFEEHVIPGTAISWEDGFIGSAMYGIKSNGYLGYTPADLESSSAEWVDFLKESHNEKYDSFCILTLPLSLLGVTAEQVQQNGIGVMSVASYGESGIGSLPMDMTMLDNALEAYSQDDSTSNEKEDADVVSAALARLGGKADVTVTPSKKPTPVVEATVTPTTAVATPTPVPEGILHVNFGADRSAPQYNTTALSVKAEAAGGKEPYSYEFFVDGQSVQSGATDTYTWQNGTAGAHKIKVIVTDAVGKTVSCEKDYDLESNGEVIATATPTSTPIVGPSNTPTPHPTNPTQPTSTVIPTPTTAPVIPTEAPSYLALTKFTVGCKTNDGTYKVGDEFIMRADSTGANGTPLYMFTYILNGEEVIVKNYGPENETSFIPETAGSYGFKVYVVDSGNTENPSVETGEIIVKENLNPTPTVQPGVTSIPGATVTPIPVVTVRPGETATPTPAVTQKPEVTEVPVITGIIPTPTHKVTVAPINTATPKPTKPTQKPTQKPTSPVQKPTSPATQGTVEKGTIVVDEATGNDYTVTSTGSNKTVKFTEYFGTKTTVVIPDVIKVGNANYKVTEISASAFKNNKKIKTVTIGNNVTKIGASAFSGCTSLQSVKLAKNVKTIGDKAFYNCKKLSSITLSSKLTTIGKQAFFKCTSLKKITIPSKVKKIGTKAFYGCKKLKNITIKTKKLKSSNVGKHAFKGIYSKATIKVPKSKLKTYKKLLKSKGVSSKTKIKK